MYRSVAEAIDHAVRTRILNLKWIESMLRHGYDGAREIVKRVRNIVGLAAITGEVPGCVFDEVARSYILDDEVRQRLIRENRWTYSETLKILYEAYERGYWRPEKEVIGGVKRVPNRGRVRTSLEPPIPQTSAPPEEAGNPRQHMGGSIKCYKLPIPIPGGAEPWPT